MNIIKVKFKKNYGDVYDGNSYTYKNFLDVSEGDIVAVETKNGLSLAKVVEVNAKDDYIGELKKTVSIVKTSKQIEDEKNHQILKEKQIRKAIRKIKEKKIRDNLLLNMDTSFLEDLTEEELDRIYNEVYRIENKNENINDTLIAKIDVDNSYKYRDNYIDGIIYAYKVANVPTNYRTWAIFNSGYNVLSNSLFRETFLLDPAKQGF